MDAQLDPNGGGPKSLKEAWRWVFGAQDGGKMWRRGPEGNRSRQGDRLGQEAGGELDVTDLSP